MDHPQRLVYRAMIKDHCGNMNDLRVTANGNGLLRIFLANGVARCLSYAGIEELKLPASVAQGGKTNKAIAAKVRAAMGPPHVYKLLEEWIEPEPKP
jgi:hypothetical protein